MMPMRFRDLSFFQRSGYLILSGSPCNAFLRSCFIPYTGFHVRCCPETPPFSLAQSGVDTAPAETTTPTGRVRAFVPRSLILTVLIPGSNRVWSWKVHLLSQRPEIVVMV